MNPPLPPPTPSRPAAARRAHLPARRGRRLLLAACALGCAAALTIPGARADITLLGTGSLPGNATDQSGLTGTYEDGTPKNQLGAFGSGITYTGVGNLYVAVPDRGPNATSYNSAVDNTTSFDDRFQFFNIPVLPGLGAGGSGGTVSPVNTATTLLTRENGGAHFTGLSSAFVGSNPNNNLRLDPEGIRVSNHNTFYVSDEYGPVIYEFNTGGQRVNAFNLPVKFLVGSPNSRGSVEISGNTSGRVANRGMEGLAITPDGRKLVGIMQSPLIQDGGRSGLSVRILTVDTVTGATQEFVYNLNSTSYGVSEIVAVNDHQFLVDERDGNGGNSAAFKQLYLIDLNGATDVSGVASLATNGSTAGVSLVSKTPFLNLLDPRFGLAGANFPEKIEGLAFGPDLADGRHLLLVTNDNDFGASTPDTFLAFAIGQTDLPGYQAQMFAAIPEPSTLALGGVATLLLGMAAAARRRASQKGV